MTVFKEEQPIETIARETLRARVEALAAGGHRLVHVACTALAEAFEVTYAFDQGWKLVNLRVLVPRTDAVVPSISGVLLAAFTYENELQDLFGLRVDGLAVDYKGNFYRKATATPMATCPVPKGKVPKPAPTATPQAEG